VLLRITMHKNSAYLLTVLFENEFYLLIVNAVIYVHKCKINVNVLKRFKFISETCCYV